MKFTCEKALLVSAISVASRTVAPKSESGACIMPARLFFDIIRKLPDDEVTVTVDEKFRVFIRGGISSFTITAMNAEE